MELSLRLLKLVCWEGTLSYRDMLLVLLEVDKRGCTVVEEVMAGSKVDHRAVIMSVL